MKVEEVTSGFESSEDIPDKAVIEQQEPNVEKTYEEYKAEKKAKKELKKATKT